MIEPILRVEIDGTTWTMHRVGREPDVMIMKAGTAEEQAACRAFHDAARRLMLQKPKPTAINGGLVLLLAIGAIEPQPGIAKFTLTWADWREPTTMWRANQ